MLLLWVLPCSFFFCISLHAHSAACVWTPLQSHVAALQAKHQQDLNRGRDRRLALESEVRSLRRALDGNQDQTSTMVRELTAARDTATAALAEAVQANQLATERMEGFADNMGDFARRAKRQVLGRRALWAWRGYCRRVRRARVTGRRVLAHLLSRPASHPLFLAWQQWRRFAILSMGVVGEEISRMLEVRTGSVRGGGGGGGGGMLCSCGVWCCLQGFCAEELTHEWLDDAWCGVVPCGGALRRVGAGNGGQVA